MRFVPRLLPSHCPDQGPWTRPWIAQSVHIFAHSPSWSGFERACGSIEMSTLSPPFVLWTWHGRSLHYQWVVSYVDSAILKFIVSIRSRKETKTGHSRRAAAIWGTEKAKTETRVGEWCGIVTVVFLVVLAIIIINGIDTATTGGRVRWDELYWL